MADQHPGPPRSVTSTPLDDRRWTAMLLDPELPVVSELLTDHLPRPLEAAVAATGGTLEHASISQIAWWPGRSATVTWDAVVEGGPDPGRSAWVASTVEAPEGATVVGDGQDRLTVWRVPHDPYLPALGTILRPEVVSSVVESLGGRLPRPRLRLAAYRPGRRAVVAASGEGDTLYLKLVRPRKLEDLHRRHLDLVGQLPVPQPLGIDRALGLLVMRHLPGRTLRDTLEEEGLAIPHPQVVADLPDRLPGLPGAATVPSAIEAVPRVVDLLGRLLPMERGRLEEIAGLIGSDEVTERVPAHGDYHEAQLLTRDGDITGLLDVDTLGVGRPGDDAGTMLGHLALWQSMSRRPDVVAAYAGELQSRWESRLDPADVRRRAAARVLGLAAGPFRVQQQGWPAETSRRIALAHHWAAGAGCP